MTHFSYPRFLSLLTKTHVHKRHHYRLSDRRLLCSSVFRYSFIYNWTIVSLCEYTYQTLRTYWKQNRDIFLKNLNLKMSLHVQVSHFPVCNVHWFRNVSRPRLDRIVTWASLTLPRLYRNVASYHSDNVPYKGILINKIYRNQAGSFLKCLLVHLQFTRARELCSWNINVMDGTR